MQLQLPLRTPPHHPSEHPAEEAPGSFRDYARRPGGRFPDAREPTAPPTTACTATSVALYIAADGTDSATNIARKLPVVLLPSLLLEATALAQDDAAPSTPFPQPTAYRLQLGAIEVALQPGQLHTALAAAATAEQDWDRICGGYASKATGVSVSSELGGVDFMSRASMDGSAASAPADLSPGALPPAEAAASQEAEQAGGSPSALQQAGEEALGYSQHDSWSLDAAMSGLAVHLYSADHAAQPSLTAELAAMAASFTQSGSSTWRGDTRWASLTVQLHDGLQEAALAASLGASAAMHGGASPRKPAPPAAQRQTSVAEAAAPGRRRSLALSRQPSRGRRPSGSLPLTSRALSAQADSAGLGSLFERERRSSSSPEGDWLPPMASAYSGRVGVQASGLLHAQSSTINLSGMESEDDTFFEAEDMDDAASFFSAHSRLPSSPGSNSLPRFSDLPGSAESSTLDLLLVTSRGRDAARNSNGPAGDGDETACVSMVASASLPGSSLPLWRSQIACTGLLLRAYTEGWGVAAACLHQCAAVIQAQRHAKAPDASAEDQQAAAPVDVAAPVIEVDCSSWTVQLVATGDEGIALQQ